DNNSLLKVVGGNILETVDAKSIIGRLVVMGSRSAQLTKVYNAVLGFDGSEFYLSEWPECVGLAFNDVAERFNDAIPIGIKTANGQILIKPRLERTIHAGDEIIVLAEDNDTYKAAAAPVVDVSGVTPTTKQPLPPPPQRILLCGWHRNIRDILILLDHLSAPETHIHLVNAEDENARVSQLQDEGLRLETLKNLEIKHFVANTAVRRHMEKFKVTSYECILVMSDRANDVHPLASDSHVIATVMMLRAIEMSQRSHKSLHEISTRRDSAQKLQTGRKIHCVAEVLDPSTERTIHENAIIGAAADYVMSNDLVRRVSRMLAMVSENRSVNTILDQLLGDNGATFDVLPATRYCEMNEHMSFWALAKRARLMYQEIICGFVDEHKAIVLNPPQKQDVVNWSAYGIVVIRETMRKSRLNGHQTRRLMVRVLKAFRSASNVSRHMPSWSHHAGGDAPSSMDLNIDAIPVHDDSGGSDDDDDAFTQSTAMTKEGAGSLRHVVTSDALLDERVRARVTRQLEHSEFNASAHRPLSPAHRHKSHPHITLLAPLEPTFVTEMVTPPPFLSWQETLQEDLDDLRVLLRHLNTVTAPVDTLPNDQAWR
ncbi:hypothetical protein As57867_000301, partial [Aphanomyces stellatus]